MEQTYCGGLHLCVSEVEVVHPFEAASFDVYLGQAGSQLGNAFLRFCKLVGDAGYLGLDFRCGLCPVELYQLHCKFNANRLHSCNCVVGWTLDGVLTREWVV